MLSNANGSTPPLNIDQRLEALTARNEALSQSVELLLQSQKQTDKELRRVGKYIRAVAALVLDHEPRIRVLEGKELDGEDDETE